MILRLFFALAFVLSTGLASAQGVIGSWRDPTGSVIAVYPCGSAVCARLTSLSPNAPTHVDARNPDSALRTHSLCGLVIGHGFRLKDAAHAENGTLYDPKTGKTYRGSMAAEGTHLDLRGYVGLKIFGRSQTWTRIQPSDVGCAAR